MRRGGVSVVELILCLGLGMVVLGIAMTLHSSSRRLLDAPEAGADRAGLKLLGLRISRDVKQLGMTSRQGSPMNVTSDSVSFYRVVFDGPRLRLVPVRYFLERPASGPRFLVREEVVGKAVDRQRFSSIPLADGRFGVEVDPRLGTVYLLVEIVATARPSRQRSAPRLAMALPVPVAPGRGNPALATCTWIGTAPPLLEPGAS